MPMPKTDVLVLAGGGALSLVGYTVTALALLGWGGQLTADVPAMAVFGGALALGGGLMVLLYVWACRPG